MSFYHLKSGLRPEKNPVFDRIFEILRTQDDITADIALSRFNLRLTEALVLHVLNYDKNMVSIGRVDNRIKFRGFEGEITHAIFFKSLCQQTELDRAEEYLRGLLRNGGVGLSSGIVVANLVDALCWGSKSEALEFLKGKKKLADGYVPDVFRYNILVYRLLRENRLEEVYDLLMDMKDQDIIIPDDVTMNVTLCFFCKVGMADVARELYDSRAEFGLSVSSMTYNYLINNLLGDASVDEAYIVLKNAIQQGHFPGRRTFSNIADALCREGKLDRVKELVLASLDRNCMPSDST
ncbi:hypothetical protein BC332_21607 [Capsicum chinense]|nr:hypothetical protein BC332_21607 [Capsicum chinense]